MERRRFSGSKMAEFSYDGMMTHDASWFRYFRNVSMVVMSSVGVQNWRLNFLFISALIIF
jgi:hypothetical protein